MRDGRNCARTSGWDGHSRADSAMGNSRNGNKTPYGRGQKPTTGRIGKSLAGTKHRIASCSRTVPFPSRPLPCEPLFVFKGHFSIIFQGLFSETGILCCVPGFRRHLPSRHRITDFRSRHLIRCGHSPPFLVCTISKSRIHSSYSTVYWRTAVSNTLFARKRWRAMLLIFEWYE